MTQPEIPPNVTVGANTLITGSLAFKRFRSENTDALVIGSNCTMEGVQFAVGPRGRMKIGDYCYLTSVVLLAELELIIGNYVAIGWNTTVADTDFHPLSAVERIADAIALSPASKTHERPSIPTSSVVIEDDVWIGPASTILKGVTIGAGSFIEPGSVVTRTVPPKSRVMGNPAKVVGQVG